MALNRWHIIFYLTTILCSTTLSAQRADSIPAPEHFTALPQSTLLSDTINQVYFDTTLQNAEDQKQNIASSSLSIGNYGQPINPLIFTSNHALGINLHTFPTPTGFSPSRTPVFYNTAQPVTKVHYQNGLAIQFENAGIFHSQNVTKNWNVSALFDRQRSTGFYQHEATQHAVFDFTSRFLTESKRYENRSSFQWTKNYIENNGGFQDRNDFIALEANQVLNRQSYPMRFTDHYSNFQSYKFSTEQIIHLGKKDIRVDTLVIPLTDTTSNDSLIYTPYLSTYNGNISLSSSVSSNNESINDFGVSDTCCYPANVPFVTDSMKSRQHWTNLTNQLSMQWIWKLDSSIQIQPRIAFKHEYIVLSQTSMTDFSHIPYASMHLNNAMIYASLPIQLGKRLQLGGTYQKVVAGFNANDENWKLNGRINLGKMGTVAADISANQKLPDFRLLFYRSPLYTWDNRNTYSQVKQQQIGAKWASQNNTISLGAAYKSLVNYTFLDSNNAVQQSPLTVNIFTARLGVNYQWRNWHIASSIKFQDNLSDVLIYIPQWIAEGDIYYSNHFFENELEARFGAEFVGYSSFTSQNYSPELGLFQLRSEQAIGPYGILSPYFSGKIDRTRFFVKAAHINALFGKGYYFSAYNYPINDFHVILGFDWTFLN